VKANSEARQLSLNSSGVSRSFNNRVNFLSSQILNLQTQQQPAETARRAGGTGAGRGTESGAGKGTESGAGRGTGAEAGSGGGRTRSERRQSRMRF
jgi:hypothetical protein